MRRLSVLLLVVLAACSKPSDDKRETDGTRGAASANLAAPAAEMRTPGVSVTSAPGVAFNYRYAFRVPNTKIGAVQEEHAMACEKLGIDRCRITGMRFRLINEDEISAMLSFKLDPAIARDFGKEGIAAITRAEGMLVDSEITGTDQGAVIDAANRNTTALSEELARVEESLKRPGLRAAERAELESQATDLRSHLRGASNTRTDARASLATTPMVFDYGSGNLIPGFDGRSPLRDALATASLSFQTMLSFIVIAIGALLPWALLLGVAWLGLKTVRRRWRAKALTTANA